MGLSGVSGPSFVSQALVAGNTILSTIFGEVSLSLAAPLLTLPLVFSIHLHFSSIPPGWLIANPGRSIFAGFQGFLTSTLL